MQDSSRLPGAGPSDGEKNERLRRLPKGPCPRKVCVSIYIYIYLYSYLYIYSILYNVRPKYIHYLGTWTLRLWATKLDLQL